MKYMIGACLAVKAYTILAAVRVCKVNISLFVEKGYRNALLPCL